MSRTEKTLKYVPLAPTKKIKPSRFRSHDETAVLFDNPPLPWILRIFFAVIVAAVLTQAGWVLSGGTSYNVGSTSMCPTFCVGALTLDLPVSGHVHTGEVVTFTPPGLATPYSHRVVKVFTNGDFKTKPDGSSLVDPWTVTPSEVQGRVVYALWGLGWLSKALPFLAIGMAAILLLRRRISVLVRRDWDRFFATLLVLIPVWILKPLIRGVLIYSEKLPHHMSRVTIVNTGLLPAQFKAVGGQFKDFISSGHVFTITGPLQKNQQVDIKEFASFHWWGWTIVFLIVLSPLISYLGRRRRLKRLGVLYVAPAAPTDPNIDHEETPPATSPRPEDLPNLPPALLAKAKNKKKSKPKDKSSKDKSPKKKSKPKDKSSKDKSSKDKTKKKNRK